MLSRLKAFRSDLAQNFSARHGIVSAIKAAQIFSRIGLTSPRSRKQGSGRDRFALTPPPPPFACIFLAAACALKPNTAARTDNFAMVEKLPKVRVTQLQNYTRRGCRRARSTLSGAPGFTLVPSNILILKGEKKATSTLVQAKWLLSGR